MKEAKKGKDADDKKVKGDVERKEKHDHDDGEGEQTGEDDDKGEMNQHSVTFAEVGGGMKEEKKKRNGGSDEDEASLSTENSASANQRLNEYTFSPSALRAAITGDGESDNGEDLYSPSGKKCVILPTCQMALSQGFHLLCCGLLLATLIAECMY